MLPNRSRSCRLSACRKAEDPNKLLIDPLGQREGIDPFAETLQGRDLSRIGLRTGCDPIQWGLGNVVDPRESGTDVHLLDEALTEGWKRFIIRRRSCR